MLKKRENFLVCRGVLVQAAIKEYHRQGGLQTTVTYFLQFWRLRSKIKAPADLESEEDLFLGSSMAVFFQSPHMAEKGRVLWGLL